MRHFFTALLAMSALASGQETSLQNRIFQARDRVLPALVHVEPIISIFSRGEKQSAVATGSGVIFSDSGYVLTNHHVAANAEKVWCTLSSKERVTAEVVGSDPSTDIAVLRLNTAELQDSNFAVAELDTSGDLEVGQIVLALGSPLGLSRSVSMGVISSIDRYFPDRGGMISPYNLWIQTDAAINPGNSGGPLINLDGRVVGINARAVFFAENLGFAIPITLVRQVAREIIAGSSVSRSWIGVEFKPIKGFRDYREEPDFEGVLITHVERHSPAAEAGVRPGDVLRRVGDTEVTAPFDEDLPAVRQVLAQLPIDTRVPITVWREGREKTLKLRTIEAPFGESPEVEIADLGMVIQNLTLPLYRLQRLDRYEGVFISSIKPGSPSELTELRQGDVIVSLNGEAVPDAAAFREVIDGAMADNNPALYFELVRNGYPYFAVLELQPVTP